MDRKASLVEVAPGGGGHDKLIGCSALRLVFRDLPCAWSALCAWAGCDFIVFFFLAGPFFFYPCPCLNSVACSLTLSHATKLSANEDAA